VGCSGTHLSLFGPEFLFEFNLGTLALKHRRHHRLKFRVVEGESVLVYATERPRGSRSDNLQESHLLKVSQRSGYRGRAADAGILHEAAVGDRYKPGIPIHERGQSREDRAFCMRER
jgi:hypothetical protein